MYSKSMKLAINEAQSCIDKCCTVNNISAVATQNISDFCEIVSVLDPCDINFKKDSFFNNIKINNYWDKFNELYPSVKSLLNKLTENKNVINNTLITLKLAQDDLLKEYNIFKSEEPKEADIEYAQQRIVADNIVSLMQNTINQYLILYTKLEKIVNVAHALFKNAVIIAKMQTKSREGLLNYKLEYHKLLSALL